MKILRILAPSIIIGLLLFPHSIFATQLTDAKVIFLHGQAKGKYRGKISNLKIGSIVQTGSVLQTASKTILKILYPNKSQITLGPESTIKIEPFEKQKPQLISFLKGTMRVQVKKSSELDKLKMIVRSKSAAMGVRGTDFQLTHNKTTGSTGVLTYSGVVTMAKLPQNTNIKDLSLVIKQNSSETVLPGRFAQTTNQLSNVTIPIKISPLQLDVLKSQNISVQSSKAKSPIKNFNSPFPPGVSPKDFKTISGEIDKQIKGSIGGHNFNTALKTLKEPIIKELNIRSAPPEGISNTKTGEFAPPAGGFVDFKTGLYVAPPSGSTYDPNTKTYTPLRSIGTIDPISGNYTAPPGYELKDNGTFEVVDKKLAEQSGLVPNLQVEKIEILNNEIKSSKLPPDIKAILDVHGIRDGMIFDQDKDFNVLGPNINELVTGTKATINFNVTD